MSESLLSPELLDRVTGSRAGKRWYELLVAKARRDGLEQPEAAATGQMTRRLAKVLEQLAERYKSIKVGALERIQRVQINLGNFYDEALAHGKPDLARLEQLLHDLDGALDALGQGVEDAARPPGFTLEPARSLDPSNVDAVIAALQRRRKVAPDEIALIRQQAENQGEKWNLPDTLRGEIGHILGGENLPHGFPTIDRFGPPGDDGYPTDVTSIKTHNLWAESFRQPEGLFDKLVNEIDELADFESERLKAQVITRGPNTKLVLQVEIPPDTLSIGQGGGEDLRAQWRVEAERATAYASTKDVTLVFKTTR